ncbi:MAG TPA: ABC transporter substrate-binding protein [Thermoplasmata archaeon]|nr:ABC transporter substrate-binding protein [Thermoplasmata archaeon]
MAIIVLFLGNAPVDGEVIGNFAGADTKPSQILPLTLRASRTDDIHGLNLFAFDDRGSRTLFERVYDRMALWNWTDGRVSPWVAVEWCRESVAEPGACAGGAQNQSQLNITVRYRVGSWSGTWGSPVAFHDGRNATIEDVLFSHVALTYGGRQGATIDQLLWTAADGYNWSRPPYGDASFQRVTLGGPGGTEGWFGARIADDHTIQFRLRGPSLDFFSNTMSVLLLPSHLWSSHLNVTTGEGDHLSWDLAYEQSTGRAPAFIGSGPFRFDRWLQGQFASLNSTRDYFDWTKNVAVDARGVMNANGTRAYPPEWHENRPDPRIDGIEFKIYLTQEARSLALQQAALDYAEGVDPRIGDPWIEQCTDLNGIKVPCGQVISLQQPNSTRGASLAFNMRRLPMGYEKWDPANISKMNDTGGPFRRALDLLIPTDFGDSGICIPMPCVPRPRGPLAPVMKPWHNDSLPAPVFDPAQAEAILNGSGWLRDTACPKIGNPPDHARRLAKVGCQVILMLTPEAAYDPSMAVAGQILEAGFMKAGLNIKSFPLASGAIDRRLRDRDFDMAIHWFRPPPVPATWLETSFRCDQERSGGNFAGYCDPAFDSTTDAYRNATSTAASVQAVRDEQGELAEDLPWIALFHRPLLEAIRKDRFVVPFIDPPGWIPGPDGVFNEWSLLLSDQVRLASTLAVTGVKEVNGCRSASLVVTFLSNGSAIEGARVTGRVVSGNMTFNDGNRTIENLTDGAGRSGFVVLGGGTPGPAVVEFDAKMPGYQSATAGHSMQVNADGCFPAPPYIDSIVASPRAIAPGGSSAVSVVVIGLGDGRPIANATVSFSVPAAGTIDPVESLTDKDGLAKAVFTAPKSVAGDAEIQIRAIAKARIGGYDLVSEEAWTVILVVVVIVNPVMVHLWESLLLATVSTLMLLLMSWLLAPRQWRRLLRR